MGQNAVLKGFSICASTQGTGRVSALLFTILGGLMKDQYFADRRDFVKYELLLDLIELRSARSKLTFIPMLTKADATKEGSITRYELGERRPHLFHFLQDALKSDTRKLRQLCSFMRDSGVTFYLHSDGEYFQHDQRAKYFDDVPVEKLTSAVVFFDPDIGLENSSASYMRRKGFEKYLFYEDVRSVMDRAPDDTIIVLYQHLQRNQSKRLADLSTKCNQLIAILGLRSIEYIKDHDVAFLVFSKDLSLHTQVRLLIKKHSLLHGLEFGVLPA